MDLESTIILKVEQQADFQKVKEKSMAKRIKMTLVITALE